MDLGTAGFFLGNSRGLYRQNSALTNNPHQTGPSLPHRGLRIEFNLDGIEACIDLFAPNLRTWFAIPEGANVAMWCCTNCWESAIWGKIYERSAREKLYTEYSRIIQGHNISQYISQFTIYQYQTLSMHSAHGKRTTHSWRHYKSIRNSRSFDMALPMSLICV